MTVKTVVLEVLAEEARLKMQDILLDHELDSDLRLDSLDVLACVMELESRLDISVTDEDLRGITTVGELVALCERGRT